MFIMAEKNRKPSGGGIAKVVGRMQPIILLCLNYQMASWPPFWQFVILKSANAFAMPSANANYYLLRGTPQTW
jgi:hypothetical protein